MNTNPESIPTDIFDWLEKFNFISLSLEQQKEVLKHFTKEEYEELHKSSIVIKSNYEPITIDDTDNKKDVLIMKFQTLRQKKSLIVLYTKAFQIAAAILFLACGWILNHFFSGEQSTNNLVASIDTVYLTKDISIDPLKIYDTIYIEKETAIKYSPDQAHSKSREFRTDSGYNSLPTIEEIGSPLNRQKRNSMKDDSLSKNFSFTIL